MAGPQSTGVDEALVTRMKNVLMDVKVDVDSVHVDKPSKGSVGGSQTAETLESLMNRATDRINSTLSETSDALIKFVDGLTNAVDAVKNADEEAEAAFRNKLSSAVDTISKPFFENLVKDDRPNMPGFQLPFIPLTPEQLQEIASRSEFGQDDGGDK
jgi:flagellar hook-basal body complex protein FliE